MCPWRRRAGHLQARRADAVLPDANVEDGTRARSSSLRILKAAMAAAVVCVSQARRCSEPPPTDQGSTRTAVAKITLWSGSQGAPRHLYRAQMPPRTRSPRAAPTARRPAARPRGRSFAAGGPSCAGPPKAARGCWAAC
eukprot:scaffold5163_cov296-Prasinococcus_capsulatus_cf.AAC.1